MTELSTREVWRAVLGELELQLPRPTFETWLKQTEGISSNDSSFVVEVPTPFAVAWLERRMYQTIQRTVERVTQRPLEVQFQVKTAESMPRRSTPVLDPEDWEPGDVEQMSSPGSSATNGLLNSRYTFGSFVVGLSNRLAFSAARAVADAPGQGYNPLFLYSGVGLGKNPPVARHRPHSSQPRAIGSLRYLGAVHQRVHFCHPQPHHRGLPRPVPERPGFVDGRRAVHEW